MFKNRGSFCKTAESEVTIASQALDVIALFLLALDSNEHAMWANNDWYPLSFEFHEVFLDLNELTSTIMLRVLAKCAGF